MSKHIWAAALAMFVAHAAPATGSPSSGVEFSDQVRQTLGLHRARIVDVAIDAAAGAPISPTVEIDGVPHRLELTPHSNRDPEYVVFVADAGGALTPVEPGPLRTLRGQVAGHPGSVVAASRSGNAMTAMIDLGDGRRVWLEPVGDLPGATAPTQHALYTDDDVADTGGACAAVAHERLVKGGGVPAAPPPAGADGGSNDVAELACDADFEFFTTWGEGTEDRINAIINQVNVQYERDVGITHDITTIIIRTEATYTATDPLTLVTQFRNRWLSEHGTVPRDLAHLFTGKDLDGDVVGIAYQLGRVCTTGAYCLSQSDFDSSFACSTDLTAHELGHLWSADHCACPSHTMNPSITCSNQFSAASIAAIIAHRDTRECLNESTPAVYCAAFSGTAGFEHIARVQTGSIDHPSGASTYSSFDEIATDVEPGSAYPITIVLGDAYFGDVGGAWIDWNADSDFDDAGETISDTFTGTGPYVGAFVVPTDALTGSTRLRVRIQDGFSDPFVSSCGTTDYGEVEDYTINVIGPPDCPGDVDGDGSVGFTDLLSVLGFWGPCDSGAPCAPSDLDGDGSVGFTDLLTVLGFWGPCW